MDIDLSTIPDTVLVKWYLKISLTKLNREDDNSFKEAVIDEAWRRFPNLIEEHDFDIDNEA